MRAIIVDDEPKSIELIKGYLEHFSSITLVGTFRNGLKAFEFMTKEKVDLVFLDIQMPHLSGLSLLKMIPEKVKIIFTTAYSEFAVESYDVESIDYLQKPISFERFSRSISKILLPEDKTEEHTASVFMIKSGNNTYRLQASDVFLLQKDGNYMHYHLHDQKVLARESVAEALSNLPDCFVQVHKSFIVNVQKIDFFNKEEISIRNLKIPIGASYKELFLKMVNP